MTMIVMMSDYIQSHCDNLRNPFHFARRQWFSGILT